MQILVIDDRKSKVSRLKVWLKKEFGNKFQIVHLETPYGVKKILDSGNFVLIFLDYMIEIITPKPRILFGDDFIVQIKRISPDIPIWMFTEAEIKESGVIQKGAEGILNPEKPSDSWEKICTYLKLL